MGIENACLDVAGCFCYIFSPFYKAILFIIKSDSFIPALLAAWVVYYISKKDVARKEKNEHLRQIKTQLINVMNNFKTIVNMYTDFYIKNIPLSSKLENYIFKEYDFNVISLANEYCRHIDMSYRGRTNNKLVFDLIDGAWELERIKSIVWEINRLYEEYAETMPKETKLELLKVHNELEKILFFSPEISEEEKGKMAVPLKKKIEGIESSLESQIIDGVRYSLIIPMITNNEKIILSYMSKTANIMDILLAIIETLDSKDTTRKDMSQGKVYSDYLRIIESKKEGKKQ